MSDQPEDIERAAVIIFSVLHEELKGHEPMWSAQVLARCLGVACAIDRLPINELLDFTRANYLEAVAEMVKP